MITMKELIDKILDLKNSKVGNIINKRINEFKSINKNSSDELFKEMCFCILTANYNAEKSIRIQKGIGECFLTDKQEVLSKKLKDYGHRFPNARAQYICESIKHKEKLKDIINFYDKSAIREWFVKNIKGLSYKEASHFLRNIGFDDYAIIDFHIIDILTDYDVIKKPKTLTKKRYIEIENELKKIAKITDLTLSELDLYLWFMETGKILK